jgi:hypothetical protein
VKNVDRVFEYAKQHGELPISIASKTLAIFRRAIDRSLYSINPRRALPASAPHPMQPYNPSQRW